MIILFNNSCFIYFLSIFGAKMGLQKIGSSPKKITDSNL